MIVPFIPKCYFKIVSQLNIISILLLFCMLNYNCLEMCRCHFLTENNFILKIISINKIIQSFLCRHHVLLCVRSSVIPYFLCIYMEAFQMTIWLPLQSFFPHCPFVCRIGKQEYLCSIDIFLSFLL